MNCTHAFAPDARSAADARRWAQDACDGRIPEAAVLVLSELVSNAYQHGAGEIVVDLDVSGQDVYIEVADESELRPLEGDPALRDEHGRGLMLVTGLSLDWGVRPRDHGKVVWVRVPSDTLAI